MRRALAVSAVAIALLGAARPAPAAIAHRALTWEGTAMHALRVPAGSRVRPVAAMPGRTVEAFAREHRALAAVNGGFFNHSDGHPVSHVMADGSPLTAPRVNKALIENPALLPILDRVFDARAEWRLLEGEAGARWVIRPHAAPVPAGFRVVHALQAGPALLPALDLEGEGFVSRDARGAVTRDGIASGTRAARSAIGLTAAGDMWLVAAAGSPKRGTGLTIAQLRALMTHLGAVSAMALDGGGSTTLAWRDGAAWRTFIGSGQAAAAVNSALVVLGAKDGRMAP